MIIDFGSWGIEINKNFLPNLLWSLVCLIGIVWSIKTGNQMVGIITFILSQIIYF